MMANIGIGDGPQYDERNPDGCEEWGHDADCPHWADIQERTCESCGEEFEPTALVTCGLCGQRCRECHDQDHADNEREWSAWMEVQGLPATAHEGTLTRALEEIAAKYGVGVYRLETFLRAGKWVA